MAVLNLNIEFLLFSSNALAIEYSDPKEPNPGDTHIWEKNENLLTSTLSPLDTYVISHHFLLLET